MRKNNLMAIALVIVMAIFAPSAMALTLPNPTDTYDGLPISRTYDEFISFSTRLLTQFGYAGFDGAAGVGGLDVVIHTQAGGIDNDPVAGGFVFEDPAPTPTGNIHAYSDTWGAGIRDNGPVYVDDLLGYLHNQFGPDVHTPVFTFDLVEPGAANKRDLKMAANFLVWDPVSDSEVASWSLDAVDNGVFDSNSLITVLGEICLTGASTTVYCADNTGSGKYDFLVYAPTMNLDDYSGKGYEFHVYGKFTDVDGGGEEAFISGGFQAPCIQNCDEHPEVPEPASMVLMATGLAITALKRKKA